MVIRKVIYSAFDVCRFKYLMSCSDSPTELCSVAESHHAGHVETHLSVLHPGEQPGDTRADTEGINLFFFSSAL